MATNREQFMNATNVATFMYNTQKEMEDAGVIVTLEHNNSHVMFAEGMMCNGYFDDDPDPEFACATKKPFDDWFPIYVHEYGHFTQWRDQIPLWQGVVVDGTHSDDFLDIWIGQGIDCSSDAIEQCINAVRDVEADCERRAMALIAKHKLPIDADRYAQMANSYVHFYSYVKLNRKWYIPGKEPYRIEEVYSQFNTTIDDEFPISHEYADLFGRWCF